MIRFALLFLLLSSASMAVAEQAGVAPDAHLVVHDAWVRGMPPGTKNSAGYLVIENRGDKDDALVSVSVAKFRVTELHEMVRDRNAMAMRRHDEVPVPAHGTVTLAPGGMHLMLIDLQQPLQAGESLEGILRFRNGGEKKVLLEVRAH